MCLIIKRSRQGGDRISPPRKCSLKAQKLQNIFHAKGAVHKLCQGGYATAWQGVGEGCNEAWQSIKNLDMTPKYNSAQGSH